MRKATEQVTAAFLSRGAKRVGNTASTGETIELHGNTIAMWKTGNADGSAWSLWITLAGWDTATTRERLNALPGVHVHRAKGQTYLNGEPWDGSWKRI